MRRLLSFCFFFPVFSFAQTLPMLKQGQVLSGFRADALYTNEAGKPMGARFLHERTGFTLDLLQIESVPQTYIWVHTFPVSEKGEPHTQEHLLITKGNKGRALNTRESMSLAESNAFTAQDHTAYMFHTGAGTEVFYGLFEGYIDALLHPDYSDEEIRREVRNWGVAVNADSTLALEEKGSVYNEMTTSMNNVYGRLFDRGGKMVYGVGHPLSNNAGGSPEAIRSITPDDIRNFHRDHYHLANMGAITSLPARESLLSVLSRMNAVLNRLEPQPAKRAFPSEATLPVRRPEPAGKTEMIPYPAANADEPGVLLFAYPPALSGNVTERNLFQNFLSVFAGDANTNLYKLLVDSRTRKLPIDAQGVFSYALSNRGTPFFIGVTDVAPANLTPETARQVAEIIRSEFARIAGMRDGSPELAEFNKRFGSRLINERRSLAKIVNTPPQFGFRSTFSTWYDQLKMLDEVSGFRKSVVLKDHFDSIELMLQGDRNIWKAYITKWGLDRVLPYAVVGKADPQLLAREEAEKKQRASVELAALRSRFQLTSDQQAIRSYQQEYEANSAELARAEAGTSVAFLSNPPLSLDGELVYERRALPGGTRLFAARFENMSSPQVGVMVRLQGVPQNKLVYLSLLPELLKGAGVIENGRALSYETMSERLQREILSLQVDFAANGNSGRVELMVRGAGNNIDEARKAVAWMSRVLQSPNLTAANLPRLRDVVNQTLSGYRNRMQGPEETWVDDPSNAYIHQRNPLVLSTSSFLTKSYHAFRLRWMLRDAGTAEESRAIAAYLDRLSQYRGGRDTLRTLIDYLSGKRVETLPADFQPLVIAGAELPATAQGHLAELAKDLSQMLGDLPDGSLGSDWEGIIRQLEADLLQSPAATLAELQALRRSLLRKGAARVVLVGSGSAQQALLPSVNRMLGGWQPGLAPSASYTSTPLIFTRAQQRLHVTETPVFSGLYAPNMPTGVFLYSVPLTRYRDTGRAHLLDFLAAGLIAGGGKYSVYSKTTGAGLSYSTGVGINPGTGRLSYYAERTPILPQTLQFVINEAKRMPRDESMKDYVLSLPFRVRSASEYEARAYAMAADFEDGIAPEAVRSFRQALLRLRNEPGLLDELYRRKDRVYERLFPGYGSSLRSTGGNYLVIGNEKQLSAMEDYLRSVEGKETRLYRLYPRDFWLVNDRQ